MCNNDPIDPRLLEEAGQLGLFTHEPEPVEEVLEEELPMGGGHRHLDGLESFLSSGLSIEEYKIERTKWLRGFGEDLEELVNKECRDQLEEEVYRERILACHPELEEEDLEDEEDLEELEDIDELRERVELLERTGDFESAAVLAALETGIPVSNIGLKLTRFCPRARAKVLSRLLGTIGEVRLVLEAEGLIPPDSEPETVHDLIHGRGQE